MARTKQQTLTEKEAPLMKMLWEHGPLFVREMVELYPDPKPHFNTVATTVRIMEEKGYVGHEVLGSSHRFYAIGSKDDFCRRTLAGVIRDYFDNSYRSVVSSLVKDEKLSVDDLREIIAMIEKGEKK